MRLEGWPRATAGPAWFETALLRLLTMRGQSCERPLIDDTSEAGALAEGEDVVGLLVMVLGLVLFFAAHVFTTKRKARAQAIAKLGEGTYKILYSLVSLAGLALIIWGYAHYRSTGWIDFFRSLSPGTEPPAPAALVVVAPRRGTASRRRPCGEGRRTPVPAASVRSSVPPCRVPAMFVARVRRRPCPAPGSPITAGRPVP